VTTTRAAVLDDFLLSTMASSRFDASWNVVWEARFFKMPIAAPCAPARFTFDAISDTLTPDRCGAHEGRRIVQYT
jgi:hypothetical protein